MLRLTGVVQPYEWGTRDVIPRLVGFEPTDEPCAEYWLGSHPRGDAQLEGMGSLAAYINEHPEVLGEATQEVFRGRLPFLLKLLSAGSPLSLQVHPSREEAAQGYASESLKGIDIDAPERSYRDDWPKPELLVALTPCDVLVGFRGADETAALFDALGVADELASVIGPLRERGGAAALQEVFLDVLSINRRRHLVDVVLASAVNHLDEPDPVGSFARTAVEIDEHFPGDPGILAALMLNHYTLEPGQAVALDAGVMHAYLRGTGVEVMASSDNVLRGGLTKKHIDVDELLRVMKFDPSEDHVIQPQGSDGVYVFPTNFAEFELWMLQPVSKHWLDLPRPDAARIALVASGSFQLQSNDDPVELTQGQAVFIPADEAVSLTGQGKLFMATSGA